MYFQSEFGFFSSLLNEVRKLRNFDVIFGDVLPESNFSSSSSLSLGVDFDLNCFGGNTSNHIKSKLHILFGCKTAK